MLFPKHFSNIRCDKCHEDAKSGRLGIFYYGTAKSKEREVDLDFVEKYFSDTLSKKEIKTGHKILGQKQVSICLKCLALEKIKKRNGLEGFGCLLFILWGVAVCLFLYFLKTNYYPAPKYVPLNFSTIGLLLVITAIFIFLTVLLNKLMSKYRSKLVMKVKNGDEPTINRLTRKFPVDDCDKMAIDMFSNELRDYNKKYTRKEYFSLFKLKFMKKFPISSDAEQY
jgi:hypothetical protein